MLLEVSVATRLQAQAYSSAKFHDCNRCVQPQRDVFVRTRLTMINHLAQNDLRLDRVHCLLHIAAKQEQAERTSKSTQKRSLACFAF